MIDIGKQLQSAFDDGYKARDDEIVRCKDCRYWWGEERQCKDEMGFSRHWNADDYCSYGERREE